MKKFSVATSLLILSFTPVFVFAQSPTLGQIFSAVLRILNSLIPFAIGLALVIFLFGVVRYVVTGSGEKKAEARRLIIFGIIALFVMVSVWGIVNLLRTALGLQNNQIGGGPSMPAGSFNSSSDGENGQVFTQTRLPMYNRPTNQTIYTGTVNSPYPANSSFSGH